MTIGSVASMFVGILKAQQMFPMSGIFVVKSLLAMSILILGGRSLKELGDP